MISTSLPHILFTHNFPVNVILFFPWNISLCTQEKGSPIWLLILSLACLFPSFLLKAKLGLNSKPGLNPFIQNQSLQTVKRWHGRNSNAKSGRDGNLKRRNPYLLEPVHHLPLSSWGSSCGFLHVCCLTFEVSSLLSSETEQTLLGWRVCLLCIERQHKRCSRSSSPG